MKSIKFIIICLTSLLILTTACVQAQIPKPHEVELEVSQEIENELTFALSRATKKHSLEQRSIEARFQDWVSQSIDLTQAKVIESRRFKNRTTYLSKKNKNIPVFLERGRRGEGITNDGEFQIYYRKSPNRFSFRKDLVVEAKTLLSTDELFSLSKNFLEENGFLDRGEFETYGIPRERKLMEDRESADGNKEVVLLQGLILNREFNGKRVVNSKITIDIHPDTREILGFKHYNWLPVSKDSFEYIPSRQVKSVSGIILDLEQRGGTYLEQAGQVINTQSAWFQTEDSLIPVREILGFKHYNWLPVSKDSFEYIPSRQVKSVSGIILDLEQRGGTYLEQAGRVINTQSAWFQTEDSLIPIMVFEIEPISEDGERISPQTFFEYVNLIGDDQIFSLKE